MGSTFLMFRPNRNETNKNIRPSRRGYNADQNPFIPERDTTLIDPIEEDRSNDSFSRNFEEEAFYPRFIQGLPMYNRGQPEFRATQITRIQTTIMDEEEDEEEECNCPNPWPSPNTNVREATPAAMRSQPLKFPTDSMLLKPNIASDRTAMLPQFAEEGNEFVSTSAPFTPRRGVMLDQSGDPGANSGYMKEFGNLVKSQLDNLETRFILYKVKLRESKSLRAFLLKKKYLLLSIPLVLCLLWLMLLLGVLIGSVFCSGMEECPWAKGTTTAPRFMYTSHSVF